MFNILGPLINPARPHGMVVGVAEKELGETFAMSLRDGGVQRALVVCGKEGLDEISCAGETWAWELRHGQISEITLHPRRFGLEVHPLKDVVGGTPEENAQTFTTLLTSGDRIPEHLTPILHFVLLNAAALLYVAGVAADFEEGARLALESIHSGKAWEALQKFKIEGQRAAESIQI